MSVKALSETNSVDTTDDAIQYLVQAIVEFFPSSQVLYFKVSPDGEISLSCSAGISTEELLSLDYKNKKNTVLRSLQSSAVFSIADTTNSKKNIPVLPSSKSTLSIPVMAEGLLIGIIDLENGKSHAFDSTSETIIKSLLNYFVQLCKIISLNESHGQDLSLQKKLPQIFIKMHKSSSIEEILQISLNSICEELGCSSGTAYLSAALLTGSSQEVPGTSMEVPQ